METWLDFSGTSPVLSYSIKQTYGILHAMLNKRKGSQKPNHELIGRFRELFPGIVPLSQGGSTDRPFNTEEKNLVTKNSQMKKTSRCATPLSNATNQGITLDIHDLNLTPSMVGLDSFSSLPHGPQYPDLSTPKLGAMSAIFHNQDSDLHTPTGMFMKHPLSPPSALQTPSQYLHSIGFESFNSQFLANDLDETNKDKQQVPIAPSSLMHRDPGHDAMEDCADGLFLDGMKVETSSDTTPSMELSLSLGGDAPCVSGEKSRFHVSLHAPTAMVETLAEIPITYLNKGQPYKISVIDLIPPMSTGEPIRYRTVIRVSFDEEEQKSNPLASWELWKEGRGLNEAQKRDGRLLAVECVNAGQGAEALTHRHVQVESSFVDGFCVTWSPNPGTKTSGCDMLVRFNFLSTDFSHSKGVKGVAVRICAKTELLFPGEESGLRDMELSYCKAKFFRDHGAERKHSHDIAHVNKIIDKLKQQIAEAEVSGGFAKRRRCNDHSATARSSDRSARLRKHKHTSSRDTPIQKKTSLEADLRSKLAITQDMFSSTRPVSVFDLRGEELDDPDSYPIRLPGSGEFINRKTTNHPNIHDLQAAVSMIPSPPSSRTSATPRLSHNFEEKKGSTTIPRNTSSDQVAGGFKEVVGIDSTYIPSVESPPKPIACLYVRLSGTEQQPEDYYRAIYLPGRTIDALINGIAEKYNIDPMRIAHIIYVNKNDLRIKVDDDVVRHFPEGQDMVMEINKAPGSDCNQDDMSESLLEIQLVF